ncbi:MAG: GAF domain-containing protein, partial [Oligoflexia bacterium]|nr:GAF domain-containing protein [Oligoflexia bacterium]
CKLMKKHAFSEISSMQDPHFKRRRLSALMFTDIVGFSGLASKKEGLAVDLVQESQQILRQSLLRHGGTENKTIGDGFFAEFSSAVSALRCAIEIQTTFRERNSSVPEEERFYLRIGLHLGDVIEMDGDSYGDGVNIASRVQALCEPGGVFLTRQIFDQVRPSEVPFPLESIGKRSLKNIDRPTEIYRVAFPWTLAKDYRLKSDRGSHLSLTSLAENAALLFHEFKYSDMALKLFSFFTLIIGLGALLYSLTNKGPNQGFPENLSSLSQVKTVFLNDGWEYLAPKEKLNIKEIQHISDENWSTYSWEDQTIHSNILKGEFWLRKILKLEKSQIPELPGMTIGIVSGYHQAYFNGIFVGGTETQTEPYAYPIDTSLIKTGDQNPNVILVHIVTPETPNPGVRQAEFLPMQFGEFRKIKSLVNLNLMTRLAKFTGYTTVVLIIAMGLFGYYFVLRPRKTYFYFALFVLTGAITLFYNHNLIIDALPYRLHRYLKFLGLLGAAHSLIGAWLFARKWKALENAHNSICFGAAGLALMNFMLPGLTALEFVERYNYGFRLLFFYFGSWLTFAILELIKVIWTKVVHQKGPGPAALLEELFIVGFSILPLTMIFISPLPPHQWPIAGFDRVFALFSLPTKELIRSASYSYPIWFTLVVLVIGIRDYITTRHERELVKERDDLILSVIKLITQHKDLDQTIAQIQSKVINFIRAERSTIYLLSGANNRKTFKAKFVLGQSERKQNIEKTIRPGEGIIGYVCATKTPLFIKDIHADVRFAEHLSKRTSPSHYKTSSCMIFPLLTGGRLLGILTVADKSDGRPFTETDFRLLHGIAKDIALILDNTRLQELVESQLQDVAS